MPRRSLGERLRREVGALLMALLAAVLLMLTLMPSLAPWGGP